MIKILIANVTIFVMTYDFVMSFVMTLRHDNSVGLLWSGSIISTGMTSQEGGKPCFVGSASLFLQFFLKKYTFYIDKVYPFNFLSSFPFSF
jgi:hypothetical protein